MTTTFQGAYYQGDMMYTLIGETLMLIDPDDTHTNYTGVPVRSYEASKTGKLIIDVTFGMNVLQHKNLFELQVFKNTTNLIDGNTSFKMDYIPTTKIFTIDVNQGDKIFVALKRDDGGNSDYTSADVEITVGYKEEVGLSYQLNGGTNDNSNPNLIMPGYTYQQLKRPTRDGYGFKGWYLEENYQTKVDAITPDMGSGVTLYAKWQKANNTASISVNGDIRANLYLDVKAYTEDENAYVKLTYNHNKNSYDTTRTTDTIYVKTLSPEGDSTYKFSIGCASGQLSDLIDAEIYDSTNEQLYVLTGYSVKAYCEEMIETSSDAKLVNLCKAILNYGGYAQQYFGYNKANIANAGKDFANDIDSVTAENVTSVKNIQANANNITIGHKISFTCLEKSSVNFYYTLGQGKTIEDFDISVSSTDVDFNNRINYRLGSSNAGNFIEIYDIASVELDKQFTLTITEKSSHTTTTITYSAMSFAKEKIEQNSNATLVKLFKALYLYNKTAKEFFLA